jgi:sugar lactone lactonase YvrE
MNKLLLPSLLLSLLLGCKDDKPAVQTRTEFHALPASARETPPAQIKPEIVATFTGPMPTGVTVSREGRIFVCFPRWGDPVAYTVAELVGRDIRPFPSESLNQMVTANQEGSPDTGIADANHLISVQSVVVDPANRLWLVDTGSISFQSVRPGGPKLVCIDLDTNTVIKTIVLPPAAALSTTYLNDIRFDLRKGSDGLAYITDSSASGPNAIIIVDLGTGKAWRRLSGRPELAAEPGFVANVGNRQLLTRLPGKDPAPLRIGADGIAISPDGQTLYWTAFSDHHLYSIRTDMLNNPSASEETVAQAIQDLGDKGFASDGLESDAAGNLYLTDYENNAVRILRNGSRDADNAEILVQNPHILFPDTLSVSPQGDLYIMSNQLHRQPNYNNGIDQREQPVGVLFKVRALAPAITGPRNTGNTESNR